MNDYDLEHELSLKDYTEPEKEQIIAEVEQRIGERVFGTMPDGKEEEFQKIFYDDIDHINWWLGENDPNYRDTDLFIETDEVINEDGNPDNIRPEKVYATIRWIDINAPNYTEIAQEVINEYKDKDWTEYLAERK